MPDTIGRKTATICSTAKAPSRPWCVPPSDMTENHKQGPAPDVRPDPDDGVRPDQAASAPPVDPERVEDEAAKFGDFA
ncbi:hypothetical protein [Sphingomonas sp. PB1R3]|uniref:hypothetical protein n=1 Tax=Sphingomonas flavida TaxID=3096154 RepID=UPI002FCB33B0